MQRLWGTKLSPRAPERLVTDPHWMAAAARTLGPAFDFWQYTALNAWEMTEGGRAHSDLEGFEQHMRWPLARLADTGFPADAQLFADLRSAASKLGPVEQDWETIEEDQEGFLTVQMRVSRGTGRKGFEILRDIITRHRRAWAERNLAPYLEERWRGELRAAGEAYHRHSVDKGKAPTVKQFAAMAGDAADHWFGGDLTGVYGALGLRSPMPPPTYTRFLPEDSRAFTRRVRQELLITARPPQGAGAEIPVDRDNKLSTLTRHSIPWVELAEALGGRPSLKQLGTRDFTVAASVLSEDTDAAWQMYCEVIERALSALAADGVHPAAPQARSTAEPPARQKSKLTPPVEPETAPASTAVVPPPERVAARNGLRRLLRRLGGH